MIQSCLLDSSEFKGIFVKGFRFYCESLLSKLVLQLSFKALSSTFSSLIIYYPNKISYLYLLEKLWASFCQHSVQFSSVAQSCLTLCVPMNCSMPGLPVQNQLPESTQTHVHRVGDATQPSHPLSSPSPPALNLSQHQGLFKCQLFTSGGQSIGVSASTSVLPMNTQD